MEIPNGQFSETSFNKVKNRENLFCFSMYLCELTLSWFFKNYYLIFFGYVTHGEGTQA
jgi:hypothetical protein